MGGGQSQPAYSDVSQISYSTEYVYVKGSGLASHQMGPWYIGLDNIFGNWPSNLNYTRRFPLHPQPAATKSINGLGPLGLWVNGVSLFNLLDGAYYDSTYRRDVMGRPGPNRESPGLWVRNAVVVESPTFDKSNAHQPPSGEYHYHDNPVALRHQLGDNIALDARTGNYHEDTSKLHHSPILGWSFDGYPIYGPYGYADPKDPNSGVRRMVSGFVIRDGAHHTVDLRKTGRRTLGKWAAALHRTQAQLAPDQYGPDISHGFTLGRYVEDFDYLGDLGYIQSKDFDLDLYNGRFCVTPEYPQGTFAYFVTIAEDGSPAFPYALGREWYGVPGGGDVRQIAEKVTVFLDAGPKTGIKLEVTKRAEGPQLKWTSVEGGHYQIESSADGSLWKTLAQDMKSQGATTLLRLPSDAAATYYRVTLASTDPYDTIGHRAGPGGPGGPGGRAPGGFGGPGGHGGGPGGPGGPPQGGPGGGPGFPAGTLSKITPASGTRGHSVTVTMTPGGIPAPPQDIMPRSVKIGNISSRKAAWNGAVVTAEFDLPADAALGVQTLTVTFPGPPGSGFSVSFTLKDGFTIR